MQPRARLIALTTAAIGLSVILAAGVLLVSRWRREAGLIESLRSWSETVRRDAVAELAAMRSSRAASALAQIIEKDCHGREWFESLYRGEGVPAPRESYVPVPARCGVNYAELHWATLALRALGPPAVPELARLLHHENSWIRMQAVAMLVRLGPQAREALDSLIAALGDGSSDTAFDDWIGFCAALALANIGCEARRAVPALRGVLAPASSETHPLFSDLANKILLDCGEDAGMSPSEKAQAMDVAQELKTWF